MRQRRAIMCSRSSRCRKQLVELVLPVEHERTSRIQRETPEDADEVVDRSVHRVCACTSGIVSISFPQSRATKVDARRSDSRCSVEKRSAFRDSRTLAPRTGPATHHKVPEESLVRPLEPSKPEAEDIGRGDDGRRAREVAEERGEVWVREPEVEDDGCDRRVEELAWDLFGRARESVRSVRVRVVCAEGRAGRMMRRRRGQHTSRLYPRAVGSVSQEVSYSARPRNGTHPERHRPLSTRSPSTCATASGALSGSCAALSSAVAWPFRARCLSWAILA